MANQVRDNDEEAIKHFELLKISILARIDDFDEFYKRNFLDERISFFEQQKFKLRKLIYNSEHGPNKVVRKEIEVDPMANMGKNLKTQEMPAVEQPEPEIQIKMNKNDYKRIRAQRAK